MNSTHSIKRKSTPWRIVRGLLGASALLGALVTSSATPARAAEPELVPLVTFYSAARGDYFTTTQPEWTCKALGGCPQDPGYVVIGIQGHVYNPALPQPAGTRPLYHWWSPSRADNFLTSDPAWAGSVGDVTLDHDGYRLFRIEGYISTSAVVGSVPLQSFWNPSKADNAAVNGLRVRMPSGWSYYRTEGYLLGPKSAAGSKCEARLNANHVDTPWTALGNYVNTWSAPEDFMGGDALQISASGQTRIDFWGAHKSVSGDAEIAGADFPLPGVNKFMLIGKVTSGRVWVPGLGWHEAQQLFPVGAGTKCLEYNTQGTSAGDLQLQINDGNLGDNAGGPTVTVSQWW
ncbi:hypothetical protein [Sorangium sp. So ce1000]|uniref:hypothetical protein n=1 Tax=Sorangium sp. So ce1000 TaxID=3133325 RepID=UPI003F622E22